MEYKVQEEPQRDIQIEIGGFIKINKHSWRFVPSHQYQIQVPTTITIDKFITQRLNLQVAATGRSDARGRGSGIILGEEQAIVLDTEEGSRSLLRLFIHNTDIIKSNIKTVPYNQIQLIPRGDSRLLSKIFSSDTPVRGFLDPNSPDSAQQVMKSCAACTLI